jgi:hypothetical protein
VARTPYPARQAAGPASGILGGYYPSPGYGLGIGGFRVHDDFVGQVDKADCHTELRWDIADFSSGLTLNEEYDGPTELGIMRAHTGSSGGAGGHVWLDSAVFMGGMPVGLAFSAKLRGTNAAPASLGTLVWSGLIDSTANEPSTANARSFIGFRGTSNGTAVRWYGVVKDGATAANESTVDLGYDVDDTWRIFGCRRTATGVQFFQVDASKMDRYGYLVTDIGSEVTTNIPTANLLPVCLGLHNGAASGESFEVDFYTLAGTIAR